MELRNPKESHWYIRRILPKFAAPVIGDACKCDMYQGGFPHTDTKDEIVRDMALSSCMSITSAGSTLSNVDAKIGFKSRGEFCGYLSDAVASPPHMAKKWTWSKKHAKRHLYMACKAIATEWHLNNGRIRRDATPKLLTYMASGTTGVGDISAEPKRRPRGNSPSTRAHTKDKDEDFPDIEAPVLLKS